MENAQNKYSAFAALAILVILILVAFLFKPEQPIETPIVFETPLPSQVDPALNARIVSALVSFATVAPDINDVEAVCVGGFINERVAPLKAIADDIVKSRLINPETMEFAKTQDEAGITCESTSAKWALFTALNKTGTDSDPEYYCVDSSGSKGKFALDREATECVVGR